MGVHQRFIVLGTVRVQSLRELRHRVLAAVERITPEMRTDIWPESDYRYDLVRVITLNFKKETNLGFFYIIC